MWAQDAAAMYGYAGNSAAATVGEAVHPAAANGESSRPGHAVLSGRAGNQRQHWDPVRSRSCQQLISTVPSALQQLTSPVSRRRMRPPTPARSVRPTPRFLVRRGRRPHRNLLELPVGERCRVGRIRQPRDHHTGNHERFGRYQLVGSRRELRRRGRPVFTGSCRPRCAAPRR